MFFQVFFKFSRLLLFILTTSISLQVLAEDRTWEKWSIETLYWVISPYGWIRFVKDSVNEYNPWHYTTPRSSEKIAEDEKKLNDRFEELKRFSNQEKIDFIWRKRYLECINICKENNKIDCKKCIEGTVLSVQSELFELQEELINLSAEKADLEYEKNKSEQKNDTNLKGLEKNNAGQQLPNKKQEEKKFLNLSEDFYK